MPGIGIAVEYPDGRAADELYQAVNWDINQTMPRPGDAALFSRPASKLLGRHIGYNCDDLLALALPAIGNLVSVTHSNGKGLIEASALGVSKASVVAEIAADFGIARESVLAFGDMPNDLPLLTWAGTSCAVANAHPDGARRGHPRHRQRGRRRRRGVPRADLPVAASRRAGSQ